MNALQRLLSTNSKRVLGPKLALLVIAPSLAFTSMVIFSVVYITLDTELAKLLEKAESTLSSTQEVTTEAVWELNRHQIRNIGAGLAIDPSIQLITVDSNFDRMYEFARNNSCQRQYVFNRILTHGAAPNIIEIGKVHLGICGDTVYERALRSALILVSLVLCEAAIIAAILVLGLKKLVWRPLEQIADYLRTMDFYSDRLAVSGTSQRTSDELAVVVDAINAMRASLAEQHRRLQENEKILLQEKQRTEELSKAKSIFLASVSHELVTPMNGIVGATEILLLTDYGQRERALLGIIDDCSKRLTHHIRELLDLGRLEAGKFTINPTTINLRDFIQDQAQIFSRQVQGKGLAWELSITEDCPKELFVDGLRLGQILTNFVSNSIKFTHLGSVKLSVSQHHNTECSILLFAVTDTGTGIPREHLSKIFDKFVQLPSEQSHANDGLGLGLAISDELAKLLNGTIKVESEIGVGSTFTFALTQYMKDI
jgi:signal transduction histidine kinase